MTVIGLKCACSMHFAKCTSAWYSTPGCSLTDLTPTDAVRQCADRGLVNTLPIPSGVVCYNRTTVGSEAVYICDEGFHQNGAATRVCQSDGVWNGSIPQCLPDQGGDRGSVSVHYHLDKLYL